MWMLKCLHQFSRAPHFPQILATCSVVFFIFFKPIVSICFCPQDHIREIQDLNTRASSEIVIRQALTELDVWEVEARFELVDHTDSRSNKIKLLKDFKSIMNKVGDNQCLLQSIKNSPNYAEFLDRATLWEKKLYNVDHNLRNLNQVQRKWVYLEPIFGKYIIVLIIL